MYINPVLVGVLATVTFELIVFVGVAVWITAKGGRR